MITTSLDIIVRRNLLETGHPIHYYTEYLYHSATCLRELSFSTLKIINSANLPVNDYGAIDLPDDFNDDLAVCLPIGQTLKPLPKQDWITPLRIHDSTTGQFVPYQDNTPSGTFWGFPLVGTIWFWNFNEFGEPTGRFYGARGGSNSGYKLLRERRQIQLSEDLIGTNVVLLYISDGQSIDNATQIDPKAFSTITAYINWKRSPNRDNKDGAEGRNFYNQMRTLNARLDDLDIPTIKNIVYNAYMATIKN
jgi:hypothetical protein